MTSHSKFSIFRLRLWLVVSVCVVLALTVVFSPSAQALTIDLLRNSGGITFSETRQLPEIPGEVVNVEPQTVSLVNLQEQVPFTLHLPTWLPEGFTLKDEPRVVSTQPDSLLVGLTWQNEAGSFINLILSQEPEGAFQVGEGSVEEAQINGETAALVRGVWDGQGQWMNTERHISLLWKHADVLYTLASVGDPPLSVQDLVRVAESLQPLTQ